MRADTLHAQSVDEHGGGEGQAACERRHIEQDGGKRRHPQRPVQEAWPYEVLEEVGHLALPAQQEEVTGEY